jgi:hypothetical protein
MPPRIFQQETAMSLVKFISGDGVEHEVEETSMAAEIIRQNGFQRVDAEQAKPGRELGAGSSEPKPLDLSKLGRPALIDEAAKLGITIDADDKAQTKKVIIAAIEAKLAEEPEADESE